MTSSPTALFTVVGSNDARRAGLCVVTCIVMLVTFLFCLLLQSPPAGAWQSKDGNELIGTRAPEFTGLVWVNHKPLSLRALKGRLVLVRFWLNDCPYCKNTAGALNALYEKYRGRGLTVIGIHHPKSPRARSIEYVREGIRTYGFEFPVAMDNDWKTIRSLWLRGKTRKFTSASLLIDRAGVVRWVHEGGEFHEVNENDSRLSGDHARCQGAYRDLRRLLDRLLAEKQRGESKKEACSEPGTGRVW